jgi:hypothetical protein
VALLLRVQCYVPERLYPVFTSTYSLFPAYSAYFAEHIAAFQLGTVQYTYCMCSARAAHRAGAPAGK